MVLLLVFIIVFIFSTYTFIFFQFKTTPKPNSNYDETEISLVIAAKNEEHNLQKLIGALEKQDYPNNKFEVILIDDNSTDSTQNEFNLLTENKANYIAFKADNKKYMGKRGALQIGLEKANFNNIVITDADCIPNDGFLRAYNNYFSKDYEFVFGIAPFIQKNTLVNKIACFDNFWVHLLSFSLASLGLPYSAAARSLGFSKSAFNKIEGYKNTRDTISGDDDLLLREAVKNNLKVGLITLKNAFVFTDAKSSLKEFIRQKSRHTSTSNYYSLPVKFVLGLWHIVNLLMLISIFLIGINILFIIPFLCKIIIDIVIVKYFMKTFEYTFSIYEIIHLQFIYDILLVVYYLKGSFTKSKW